MKERNDKAQNTGVLPEIKCQTTMFAEITSKLTGRTLVENTSPDLFLGSPRWTNSGVVAAINEWNGIRRSKSTIPPVHLREGINELSTTVNVTAFCIGLEALIKDDGDSIFRIRRNHATCMIDLLLCLWRHDCLIWPRASGWLLGFHISSDSWAWGAAIQEVLRNSLPAFGIDGSVKRKIHFRAFLRLLVSRSPIQRIGDVCPGSSSDWSEKEESQAQGLVKAILSLQRAENPNALGYVIEDFVSLKSKKFKRSDPEFNWATEEQPELDLWRVEAADYLRKIVKGRNWQFVALNAWFDHMINQVAIPRNPVELFDRRRPLVINPLPSGEQSQQTINKIIIDFLSAVLVKHCAQEDDRGQKSIPSEYGLPFTAPGPAKMTRVFETHRQPMPTRYINLCAKILTENNFAWAKKTLGHGGDWFNWLNPETGKFERQWSPVRCYLMMLKLILPARTFQLRMLDSGEADNERYDPLKGWSKNASKHALKIEKKTGISKGALRKYTRKDGSDGALIFFNTNKTADIDLPANKRGYVMAWEQPDAIRILSDLRSWQEKYNPIPEPSLWSDVEDLKMRSKVELDSMGTACFLFRDPTNVSRPDLPVNDGRVKTYWLKLMDELERRLIESGEITEAAPLKIILKRKLGRPLVSLFDLHTMRVTIITALYEQGVPAEVIMKVVGHASVLMTLYYVKLNGNSVSDALNQASLKIQQQEQADWTGFLQTQERAELRSLTARSHDSAIDSFSQSNGVGFVPMDHGFCPMGVRRCSDGLVVKDPSGKESYAAVPDGPSNCVSCRFFITGPAYLVGLEAHFNDLSYRLRESSRAYQNAQEKSDTLTSKRDVAMQQKILFTDQRALLAAEAAFERSTAEVDGLALRMHATMRLLDQCMVIANEHPRSDGFALVMKRGSANRIEAMFEETHELHQLQRICAAADIFESLQIDAEKPNLQRMRFFDQMLEDSGLQPRFCLIKDPAIARKAANEMGQLLYARYSNAEIERLAKGQITLKELGFSNLPTSLNLSRSTATFELSVSESDEPSRQP